MFVVKLARLHQGLDHSIVIDGDETLPDIPEDAWYAAPARWALEEELVLGMDGCFAAGEAITLEQAVTLLWRYAQQQGLCADEMISSSSADGSVKPWAAPAFDWAAGAGMLTGFSATGSGDALTRLEAVQLMLSFMEACGL